MATGRSLWLRAVVAVALMILFFAFAAAVAGLLLWIAIQTLGALGSVRVVKGMLLMLVFAAALLVAAALILWSLVPRIDKFEPPGPELDESDAPELFAEIRAVASATEQRPPRHIYLVDDVNAFVTERGGWMGIGSQRVMGIGLPLLELLTVSELRAVIAHEFGHFHGGDTKLGPWIYKTRAAIGRTIVNLAKVGEMEAENGWMQLFVGIVKVIRAPFLWFGNLYMRITQAISRAQEYGADALAVKTVGTRPLVDGLKKTHVGGFAYTLFHRSELGPLVEVGYRAPLADGYRRFIRADGLQQLLDRAMTEELANGEQDPYDSHPPLRERVAAAEQLAGAETRPDARAAIELLADVAALETRLMARGDGLPTPVLIAWEDAIAKVYEPKWRARVKQERRALKDLTLRDLNRDPHDIRRRARKVIGGAADEADMDDLAGWFAGLVGTAVVVALIDRGWTVVTAPGEDITVVRDGTTVRPFIELRNFLAGELDAAAWRARIEDLGIAELALDRIGVGGTGIEPATSAV